MACELDAVRSFGRDQYSGAAPVLDGLIQGDGIDDFEQDFAPRRFPSDITKRTEARENCAASARMVVEIKLQLGAGAKCGSLDGQRYRWGIRCRAMKNLESATAQMILGVSEDFISPIFNAQQSVGCFKCDDQFCRLLPECTCIPLLKTIICPAVLKIKQVVLVANVRFLQVRKNAKIANIETASFGTREQGRIRNGPSIADVQSANTGPVPRNRAAASCRENNLKPEGIQHRNSGSESVRLAQCGAPWHDHGAVPVTIRATCLSLGAGPHADPSDRSESSLIPFTLTWGWEKGEKRHHSAGLAAGVRRGESGAAPV